MDQVTDISKKLSMGGRLYQDARKKDAAETAPTPPPKVEVKAPEIPKPWTVGTIESPKAEEKKKPIDWQQINSTLLEVAGMGSLTAGFSILHIWLGLIVGGACLTVFGVAVGMPSIPTRPKGKS